MVATGDDAACLRLGCPIVEPRSGLAGEPGAWEAFEAVLRSPLPVAFRFTGWDAAAHALRYAMETEHAAACLAATGRPLPWYPDRLAWQACNPATLCVRDFHACVY